MEEYIKIGEFQVDNDVFLSEQVKQALQDQNFSLCLMNHKEDFDDYTPREYMVMVKVGDLK